MVPKQLKVLKIGPFFISFFFTLLEYYRVSFQVIVSIEKHGFEKFLYFAGHDLLLAKK